MSCQHVWERRDKQTWCLPYYICTECEMELSTNQYESLQQAHRQGWEQCQREAMFIIQNYEHNPDRDGDFADQLDEEIASMEYKEDNQ